MLGGGERTGVGEEAGKRGKDGKGSGGNGEGM